MTGQAEVIVRRAGARPLALATSPMMAACSRRHAGRLLRPCLLAVGSCVL